MSSPAKSRSHLRAAVSTPVKAKELEATGVVIDAPAPDVPSEPPPGSPVELASVTGLVVVVVGAAVDKVAAVVGVVEGTVVLVVVEDEGGVVVVVEDDGSVVVVAVEDEGWVVVTVVLVVEDVEAAVVVVVDGGTVVVVDGGTVVVVLVLVVEDVGVDSVLVASQQAVLSSGAMSIGSSPGTNGAKVSVKAATSIDVGLPMQEAGKAIENC
jgi:hypothetical protein